MMLATGSSSRTFSVQRCKLATAHNLDPALLDKIFWAEVPLLDIASQGSGLFNRSGALVNVNKHTLEAWSTQSTVQGKLRIIIDSSSLLSRFSPRSPRKLNRQYAGIRL